MSTISAIPDDQTYLKPKKSASSNLKLIVAGAAVMAFALGAVVATATSAGVAAQATASLSSRVAYELVDDDSAASLSHENDLPAPGWDTCDWIRSNGNTKGQHRVGYASSPWDCIAMVREFYPDATIATIEDSGAGSCYAQVGSEPKYQSDSIFKSCVLASMPPGSDLDTHGCKASAGFTWCDRTQSCLRDFETPCSSAPVKDVLIDGVPCRGENVVQSKFDDEACNKGEDAEGEVCSNDVAPGAEMWLDHFQYTCNYDVGTEGDTHCARCRVPLEKPDTPVDMMHQGQPVSCLLKTSSSSRTARWNTDPVMATSVPTSASTGSISARARPRTGTSAPTPARTGRRTAPTRSGRRSTPRNSRWTCTSARTAPTTTDSLPFSPSPP